MDVTRLQPPRNWGQLLTLDTFVVREAETVGENGVAEGVLFQTLNDPVDSAAIAMAVNGCHHRHPHGLGGCLDGVKSSDTGR